MFFYLDSSASSFLVYAIQDIECNFTSCPDYIPWFQKKNKFLEITCINERLTLRIIMMFESRRKTHLYTQTITLQRLSYTGHKIRMYPA